MIKSKRRKLTVGVVVLVVFLLVGYAYLQSERFLKGPQLSIHTPKNGALVRESGVVIAGEASNIAQITLNDFPIFVDESGFFSEKLLLHPGYNIMSVKVKDKFGREKEERLELVFKEEVSRERATSTQSSIVGTSTIN